MKPLDGTLVLDASRMLPGAVLARLLLELGARLIKIEDPARGDPMRSVPPVVDGIGAGFREFYAGAQSLGLDLRHPEGAARLRKLARHADIMVESFRPGSLERWGLGPERLAAVNPGLVVCRLSAFGAGDGAAGRVAHDLDLIARTGLLGLLSGGGVPRVQVADVAAGVLAACALLGALLGRRRSTGRGTVIEQPLAAGALPFVAWPLADAAAGGGGVNEPGQLLGGGCPAYRIYECAGGEPLAVGMLEPKFWTAFVEMLGLPELRGAGLDLGEEGRRAADRVASRLAERPRGHWLDEAEARGLPLGPVRDLTGAAEDRVLRQTGAIRPDGTSGAFLPACGPRPGRPAPALGEHDARIAEEFGLSSGS